MTFKRRVQKLLLRLRALGPQLDRLAAWLFVKEAAGDTPVQAARGVIRLGLWTALACFGVGGLWSALAPLDSAAVASGLVVIDSNRKTIQHLEGGIVDEILVREGEQVKAGQVLVRLHETASKARLESLKNQHFAARAAEARLVAERDGLDAPDFSRMPSKSKEPDADEREVLANQQQIFNAHASAFRSQVSIIEQKIEEHKKEIEGLSEQVKAETRQIALLDEEIEPVRRLLEKGYSSKPRLIALQREAEQLRGMRGQNIASIAQARQAIDEAKLQIIGLKEQRMADTVKELKDTQLQIADLEEQIRTSADIHDRVLVASPLDGYVTGLNIHTIGGVISPGEKLMDIVPTGDRLIIEAQVAPHDIHAVHPGLIAHVRLTAYKTRHMPTVDGKVITVSADRISDPRTGNSYYLARIEADPDQLKKLEHVTLTPGMPADVLIVTGSRTLMAYLFDPITETMHKAFRED